MSRSEAQAVLTSAATWMPCDPSDASTAAPQPATLALQRSAAALAFVGWAALFASDATGDGFALPMIVAEQSASTVAADSVVFIAEMPAGAPATEDVQWRALIEKLAARVVNGSLTRLQRERFLAIWHEATRREPSLRRPAVGVSGDGHLQASWSFTDTPGRVFTIEIHPGGLVDWFFRDPSAGVLEGADDELSAALPAEAFAFLVSTFNVGRVG